ncbi:MAG: heavy-metal-associated domain-containing protein [Candidatus Tectomicrobia bacterium]|nr:heavy-metal-associated domain-containing protein [Candidatus Tectomicrobia bacterium]
MFFRKKAPTENIVLTVEGMSCDHCKMTVEKGLKELEGVASVKVDLDAKLAKVSFDPAKVSLDAMKAKIVDLGYQA